MDPVFRGIGAGALPLVLPDSSWVHRRVQTFGFRELGWTEIRLSVDFDVPLGPDGQALYEWVPITFLPKWPPLFRFDFVDATNSPVPLLTSVQNGAADYGLMCALASAIDPDWLTDKAFQDSLMSLTQGPETDLWDAWNNLWDFVAEKADTSDPRVGRFLDIASTLPEYTILWFPSSAAQGRTVAKLSYYWPLEDGSTLTLRNRVQRSLAWEPSNYTLLLPHCGGDANFHLEVEAPESLVIRDINQPFFVWLHPADESDEGSDPVDGSKQARFRGLKPDQFVAHSGNLAHAYISGPRPASAEIDFSISPPKSGFVGAAFVASLVIAVFATVMFDLRSSLAEGDNRDAAVAVLALVPALIGYLVVRPSDSAVVRRHLVGVQLVVSIAASMPIVMALLLMKYAGDGTCLARTMLWPVGVSWICAALMLVSVARAAGHDPRLQSDEH